MEVFFVIKIILGVLALFLIMLFLKYLLIYLFSSFCRKNYVKKKREKPNIHNKKGTYGSTFIKLIYRIVESYVRSSIIRLGKIPSHWYRKFVLKHFYRLRMGKKVVVYGGFEIRSPWNISIGDGTIIGHEAKLDGRNEIVIGNNVNFSTGVWIWTEQHDFNDTLFRCNGKGGIVKIGDRAWVSSRSTILPGCTIGKGSVIAANALVNNDCEDYIVYGGVPCRKIAERNKNLNYKFEGEHMFFY